MSAQAQDRGLWADDDLRRAFVLGAKWWEYVQSGGFSMWPSDVDRAEAEAERCYPEGRVIDPAEAR